MEELLGSSRGGVWDGVVVDDAFPGVGELGDELVEGLSFGFAA